MKIQINHKKIGRSIASLRLKKGYTQEDFGKAFGAGVRQVRRWEVNGINKLDLLELIAEYFKVSVMDIIKGKIFK